MAPTTSCKGNPAAKATEKVSDSVKKTVPEKAAPNKAAPGKKQSPRSVAKSTAAQKASSLEPPLPSPTDLEVGNLIPHRTIYLNILSPARQGPQNNVAGIQPFGVVNPGYKCYVNSVVVLLMNIPTFVGYLNRINGSNTVAALRDNDTQAMILSEKDALSYLNDIAIAYWANAPVIAKTKQTMIDRLVDEFWTYTMNAQAPFGCPSFNIDPNPRTGEVDTTTFQDAGDFINAVFQIILTQLWSSAPSQSGS